MKPFIILLASILLFSACKEDEGPIGGDDLPKLYIQNVSLKEGNDQKDFAFEVRMSPASEQTVSVSFVTNDGTAIAGEDYVSTNGSISFPAGSTSQSLTVSIIGDDLKEGDEEFTVTLSSPQNATIGTGDATGTIINDDDKLAITDEGYTTPTSYTGMKMLWQDEFDGTSLDAAAWTYEIGDGCPNLCGWGNNERQYYTNSADNLYLTQGKMIIEAKEQRVGNSDYSSARIITRDKFSFKYGRVDVRAILPAGQGLWPAIWMLPQEEKFGGWPRSGEIDIMELVGHLPKTVYSTVHYGTGPGSDRKQYGTPYRLNNGTNFQEKFHVFSLVWVEDKMEFYVDDVLIHTVTPALLEPGSNYPFNESFFFIMNVAVGGEWPGDPDATTDFPQNMIVDYIRVFQPE